MSVLLGSCPPRIPLFACNGGDDSSWCHDRRRSFASLSSPSSLANSCAFLIGIRRNIRNLVWFALATVLGRRGRVLFLVRLKNRRDFSPNSLCLNCNVHGLGVPFYPRRKETWNFRRVPRLIGVENIPLRAPYIEGEIWGSSLSTKLKKRMSNETNSTQSPREPSVSKSAPPHKGTIEYASCIPKQSVSSPKRKH